MTGPRYHRSMGAWRQGMVPGRTAPGVKDAVSMQGVSPSLVSHGFDSDTVSPADRIDYWRHGLISTHTVELDEQQPFHASGQVWKVGDFILTGGTMTPQRLVRTAREIRQDQLDHYGLFTVGSGARIAIIDGTETRLTPGDLQIFDFWQAETSISLGGRTTTLYLPRDLIDGLFPGFSRFHGTVLRDERATLLARHLVSMHRYLGAINAEEIGSLVDLTMSCALDTLQRSLAPGPADLPHAIAQRTEIVEFIRSGLADPNLSPATILARFPLSRSSLFRLFEADGGVKRVIRQERLRAIRSHLLDEGDSRSIEDLALAYGFSSDWSLTRAFREVYGVTPASLRRAVSATSHDPAAVPSIRDIVQS